MNSYILKSLREEKSKLSRPVIRRSGKKKSCFIDHNDYIIKCDQDKEISKSIDLMQGKERLQSEDYED